MQKERELEKYSERERERERVADWVSFFIVGGDPRERKAEGSGENESECSRATRPDSPL